MDQYLVKYYTVTDKIHVTNLINYSIKELYSTKTLHIHINNLFECSQFYNLNKS